MTWLVLAGRKNRSIGYARARRQADEREICAVLDALPARYLDVFERPPYADCAWAARLRANAERQGVRA